MPTPDRNARVRLESSRFGFSRGPFASGVTRGTDRHPDTITSVWSDNHFFRREVHGEAVNSLGVHEATPED